MREFSRKDLQAEVLAATIGGHTTRIAVLPQMGANLTSFQVDGREFIHFDPDSLLADSEAMTGAFQMFPTPCRLTGSKYTFQGREILQRKQGEDVFIHGLVRDEAFQIAKAEREVTSTLDITERHPVHEGFPFPGRLVVVHRLVARGLEVHFEFENLGDSPAPIGYGLHPFWRIPGDRADVMAKVPGEYTMELVDLIPTGKLIPVAETDQDWREYRSLAGVEIDAVFYPRGPDEDAGLMFLKEGIRLKIEASPNMKHMICYAPGGQPFVCVENLTCSPDAPNLYGAGFKEESGMTIVPPRERLQGWIRYTVEEM